MILIIVATSVSSKKLFSTAGNIVNSKRAALLLENVNKLVFLHENMPQVHLKLNANVMLVHVINH